MPRIVRVKTSWICKVYDCAREGLGVGDIAELLGIDERTLKVKKRLMGAIKCGQKKHEEGLKDGAFNLSDYVYGRLGGEAKKLWDEICAVEKSVNGVEKVEYLLNKSGLRARQNIFLHALMSSNFRLSVALRKVNISRKTFNTWCEEPVFLGMINDTDMCMKDFIQDSYMKLIKKGDTAAIIHGMKTKNRDRGFGEKSIVEIQGNIQHTLINIDVLDSLPLEEKQHLLDAVREHKKKIENKEVLSLPANIQEAAFANSN